jgi:hypothetical protein
MKIGAQCRGSDGTEADARLIFSQSRQDNVSRTVSITFHYVASSPESASGEPCRGRNLHGGHAFSKRRRDRVSEERDGQRRL